MSEAGAPPAFAVERTLGRLARWLRILGYDAAWGSHLAGRGLLALARAEGRTVLTRDRRLAASTQPPPRLLVQSDHFREQLRHVASALGLDGARRFGRCLECNRPLEPVACEDARTHVPEYVFATQHAFRRCAGCGRIFWDATHRQHVEAELAALGVPGIEARP